MHYFIIGSKDSTIYSREITLNAGLDQILTLEHENYLDKSGSFSGSVYQTTTISGSYVSRIVMQFDFSDWSASIVNGSVSSASVKYFLNLFISEADHIPLSYSIYAHPLSQSWEMGAGWQDILPFVSQGVSWQYRDGEATWSSPDNSTVGILGGSYLTGSGFDASQSFNYQSADISMDVTDIVNKWLTGEISNSGFIIKRSDTDEAEYGKEYGTFKFFGINTHTVYRPRLEAVWDDSVWNLPISRSYTYTTESSSTSWNVGVTSSYATNYSFTGSGIVGTFATASIEITALAEGDKFYITSSAGSQSSVIYTYSASVATLPTQAGNVFYFITGSSLSGSIENLAEIINDSYANSIIDAEGSASYLFLSASLQGTFGNDITFQSGSTQTFLSGGLGYYSSSAGTIWTSHSYTAYTSSVYSYTASLNLYATQSWIITEVSNSYIFTSGSNTEISYSVISRTSSSVYTYTASLGSEFIASVTADVSYSISFLTGSSIWYYSASAGIYESSSISASVKEDYTYLSWSITGYATASSSTPLLYQVPGENFVVYFKDLRDEYLQNSNIKFRIGTRDRYPRKTFTTGSWYYIKPYYLPSSSYYSIRDAYTEEEIVPFRTDSTKISCDNSGSYFNLWLNGYEPERFYRVLLKVVTGSISSSTETVYDEKNKFRIIR
jgi:hypothetical protein